MLIADILHSCRDEGIAHAAVSSIGGAFAAEMRVAAARRHLSLGAFAAALVHDFARTATERDWRDLLAATRGTDLPVLSGLATIATIMMARQDGPAEREIRRVTPAAIEPSQVELASSLQ